MYFFLHFLNQTNYMEYPLSQLLLHLSFLISSIPTSSSFILPYILYPNFFFIYSSLYPLSYLLHLSFLTSSILPSSSFTFFISSIHPSFSFIHLYIFYPSFFFIYPSLYLLSILLLHLSFLISSIQPSSLFILP